MGGGQRAAKVRLHPLFILEVLTVLMSSQVGGLKLNPVPIAYERVDIVFEERLMEGIVSKALEAAEIVLVRNPSSLSISSHAEEIQKLERLLKRWDIVEKSLREGDISTTSQVWRLPHTDVSRSIFAMIPRRFDVYFLYLCQSRHIAEESL